MLINFRLNSFKAIGRWLDKTFPVPVAFFLKGWLYGLETTYIASKARAAVEKGIAPNRPPLPVIDAPRRLIEPSEVDGLDVIGYTYEFTRNRDETED